MRISQKEFAEACRVISEYYSQWELQQIRSVYNERNKPEEKPSNVVIKSMRLHNILKKHFDGVDINSITKDKFMRCQNAGMKTWKNLCELTGKDPYL